MYFLGHAQNFFQLIFNIPIFFRIEEKTLNYLNKITDTFNLDKKYQRFKFDVSLHFFSICLAIPPPESKPNGTE